jgi:prolipoprotein diacylglyceryl transferase
MTTTFLAAIPSPPRGVWHLGPIAIRAYAICIIAGIILAVWWGNRRFVARGGRPGRITDLAVFMVPFGLIGGRLYHVITDHELYFGPGRNPWNALAIWNGGLGIWGAVALGAVGAWIGCRYYRIPLAPVADALAPGLIAAQAVGRLGNWFNQELFGSPTTLPWALEVYVRTPGGGPGANIYGVNDCEFPTDYIKASPEVLCGAGYYHPTFLYELLWNLAIAAILVWADRRFRMGGGRVFALYVAGYTLGRGWIEMLRIDPARTHLFGLRINVITSIVLFLLAVAYLIWKRNVGREDPALLQGLPGGAARKAALAALAAEASAATAAQSESGQSKTGESDTGGTDPPGKDIDDGAIEEPDDVDLPETPGEFDPPGVPTGAADLDPVTPTMRDEASENEEQHPSDRA